MQEETCNLPPGLDGFCVWEKLPGMPPDDGVSQGCNMSHIRAEIASHDHSSRRPMTLVMGGMRPRANRTKYINH